MEQAQLDPSHIMQVGMGFWPSKTVLSAVELELFTELGSDAMTAEEIQRRLRLHHRGTYDFLDALVALQFLERDGAGAEGRYRNTPETRTFLDKRSPMYIGGILEMATHGFTASGAISPRHCGPATAERDQALRQADVRGALRRPGPARAVHATRCPGISRGNFHALAEKFDFSRYKTVCDVGGATGQLSHDRSLSTTRICAALSFDLPVVAPIAEKAIGDAGLSDRVQPRLRRLLRRPSSRGGRHHDGPDPA